ncbi:ParA family protein, partial [Bifidobacterium sp.]
MRIAIANRKGGCAKTTSAVYLCMAAWMRGIPVRLYDADPQGSATLWYDLASDDKP